MEQLGQTSANGLRNLPPNIIKPAPQAVRVSKMGGPRFSFQQRVSSSQLKTKTSNLNITASNAFEKAKWELALENTKKKMNRYWKGEEIGIDQDLEHFKIYGPGIYLFFSFLKSLTVIFLLMSIVELVPVIYNYASGTALSTMTASTTYYFAKTTIGNLASTQSNAQLNKLMNVVPDMVCIFIFICFYFHWLHRGSALTEEVRKEVKLRSYTVLELHNPPNVTEEEVKHFFSQFGKVLEVAPVKDYDETISLSKTIFQLEVEVKQLELEQETSPSEKLPAKIAELKEKIDETYKELVLYQDDTKEDILKYYITFDSVEERERAIKELTPFKPKTFQCCVKPPPENLLLGGERVTVEACHTEPGEIIWENQHVTWRTRWWRALTQALLLVLVVAVGFLLISFLNIIAPASSTSIDTSSYTSSSIQSQTNSTIVQSWCISNSATVLSSTDSALNSLCWDYIKKYYIKVAATVGISICVFIVKALTKMAVTYLGKFQRHKSHTDQSKDITTNLLMTYLCTTVLITFLLQANIGSISFKSFVSFFVSNSYLSSNIESLGQYSDFVSEWYTTIGYQIFLTWVIMIVHPNLTMPLVHYIQEAYSYWKAQGMQVQTKMEKALEPMQFDIEDHYANTIMLVFVSLSLSGGMPIITIATFFALWFRYIYLKYIFVRYCKVPKTYDEALDLKVTGFLPYAVVLHFMIAIWMFGVSSIFNSESSSFTDWVNGLSTSFVQQIAFIMSRLLGTWYFSVFFVAILAVFTFKVIVYNLIARSFLKDSKEVDVIQVRSTGDEDAFNKSSNNICDSYKIEHNPDYAEVLSIMKKKRKFVVRVKDMISTS